MSRCCLCGSARSKLDGCRSTRTQRTQGRLPRSPRRSPRSLLPSLVRRRAMDSLPGNEPSKRTPLVAAGKPQRLVATLAASTKCSWQRTMPMQRANATCIVTGSRKRNSRHKSQHYDTSRVHQTNRIRAPQHLTNCCLHYCHVCLLFELFKYDSDRDVLLSPYRVFV
jgi:hypothetical protein